MLYIVLEISHIVIEPRYDIQPSHFLYCYQTEVSTSFTTLQQTIVIIKLPYIFLTFMTYDLAWNVANIFVESYEA